MCFTDPFTAVVADASCLQFLCQYRLPLHHHVGLLYKRMQMHMLQRCEGDMNADLQQAPKA